MKTITAAEIRNQFTETRYLGQSPSLFVSADDLPAIKSAARVVLPDMQPQHRLEAIARALRFGSFASMKQALMRATPENPLLLQMSFAERSSILEDGFKAFLTQEIFETDETGMPLQLFGYVALGAVFLSALHSARAGKLAQEGEYALLHMGVDDKISALHRTASLQGLPAAISNRLRAHSAVRIMPSGVQVAPIARITMELEASGSPLLVDEVNHLTDYDMDFPDYAGDGGCFGKIPLDTAVFVSDEKSRIDVLPYGWVCSWRFDFGANCSEWDGKSTAERLKLIKRYTRPLVEELGVSRQEIGIAFKLIPELANEPEARAAPDVATPRTRQEVLMASFDGKPMRL